MVRAMVAAADAMTGVAPSLARTPKLSGWLPRGTGGGMDVMNVAIDHVLLREYRADAQANAVQREVAVLRICGDAVDNL